LHNIAKKERLACVAQGRSIGIAAKGETLACEGAAEPPGVSFEMPVLRGRKMMMADGRSGLTI
jgi:hypothetical protein